MLDNNFRDPKRRKAITCGTAERFLGTTVDLLIFLPSVAEDSERSEADLMAHDPTLCIQAMAAARCGLHVIGDLALCRDVGGYLALLADMATLRGTGHHDNRTSGPTADESDDTMERAFGAKASKRDASDPGSLMANLLDRARLYYQPISADGRLAAELPEEAQAMLGTDPHFRVIAAFGVVYCLIARPPMIGSSEPHRREREKAAEAALAKAGYRVFWFETRELEDTPDIVVERLRQLI